MSPTFGGKSLHIVMFPWLALGHMLPFLELAKSLARKGHLISFISTPRNIQRLPKLSLQIAHLIRFVPLTLPQTEGLREFAEATIDLPPEEVPYLKKALDGLEKPFYQFIKETSPKPDWIIQDFAHHWIPRIGVEKGVPCIFYISFSAASFSFFGPADAQVSVRTTMEAFTVPPPWVPFPSKVAYRPHEVRKLSTERSKLPNPSGIPDHHRYTSTIQGCEAMALRSCKELESEYLGLLEGVYKKPVIPVGLLPPSVCERSENGNLREVEIMEWLEKQIYSSVVYVALGSEVVISIELLKELAFGLENAKLPFIWALRKPFGLSENEELLPPRFEDRIMGYGKVVMGWVPQVKILAHESVGGFLTHCGWSSTIEGLQCGKPLVLLPISLDQGLNARLMEEKGVGFEVERREDDGSFTRDDVAKAVRLVMVEEKGEAHRKRAKEMKTVFANKDCHEKYVEDFIQYLLSQRPSEVD